MSSSSSSKSSCSRCKGCVCRQLRKLQSGTEVDLFLKGGTVIEDTKFVSFNKKTCCAFFCDSEEEPGVIVVDCREIAGFRFEAE
ncbi:hydrolase [Neobacillus cucumis]|uniref:hydrolase n=1 Tax=Neobacillus cucumis TaxID=1740721 RepID=UPI0018DF0BA9|nr:hydrolase [Neobacillus cucumis]MBI0580505.1 hydrolase [Neobacillus cucumis]